MKIELLNRFVGYAVHVDFSEGDKLKFEDGFIEEIDEKDNTIIIDAGHTLRKINIKDINRIFMKYKKDYDDYISEKEPKSNLKTFYDEEIIPKENVEDLSKPKIKTLGGATLFTMSEEDDHKCPSSINGANLVRIDGDTLMPKSEEEFLKKALEF